MGGELCVCLPGWYEHRTLDQKCLNVISTTIRADQNTKRITPLSSSFSSFSLFIYPFSLFPPLPVFVPSISNFFFLLCCLVWART